jgi:transposase
MAANLTTEQRVAIVKLYFSSNSVTQVQRDWRKTFASVAPTRKTIYDLIHKFEATGSVLDAARSGRPRSVNTGEARVGLKEVLKRSPVEWPARSPDLTPPEFLLWGGVKDRAE